MRNLILWRPGAGGASPGNALSGTALSGTASHWTASPGAAGGALRAAEVRR
ncbi:hypothetical protein LV78_000250 [Actinosynnema pretiosum]|nr:hypothetical protein [Actinosynnema pretiosum]